MNNLQAWHSYEMIFECVFNVTNAGLAYLIFISFNYCCINLQHFLYSVIGDTFLLLKLIAT